MDRAVAELAPVAAPDDQPGHLERGSLDVALIQRTPIRAGTPNEEGNVSDTFTKRRGTEKGDGAHRLHKTCTARTHCSGGGSEPSGSQSSTSATDTSHGI